MVDSSRRLERERVLTLLYEAEIKGETLPEVLAGLAAPPEKFVTDTACGVFESKVQLDGDIERHASNWDPTRMALVDLNVMRIGAWELHNRPDLSIAVIISEAVELAKRFSTEESGRFVNGVLAALAAELRL